MLLEVSDIEVSKKPLLENSRNESLVPAAAQITLALDYQFYSVVNRHFVTK
jgi:hypothetical protein